ncbi:hypothetical protein CAOG_04463 [Capsaspora owczarzaki ATCC 30864]|uniref:Uncharacterized protein n=1 Tax=Capsaspora owczarzaki (strain ATCC 30864) TaxID=595528 RepID=A0A0D2WQ57_CAPO3|nr:hypothetical protein CAOG_04463 [Capsaspora owczarzaki ATCC 30864]KJE93710.1 hypothetical protein CAOG_004463 [Capsaspora owczarzaki ATCC 30864]|eukprot:XP_004348291.2 hypothetical protein CAOG_04463 [Capsaspora owczarzaki ATCC 30864]
MLSTSSYASMSGLPSAYEPCSPHHHHHHHYDHYDNYDHSTGSPPRGGQSSTSATLTRGSPSSLGPFSDAAAWSSASGSPRHNLTYTSTFTSNTSGSPAMSSRPGRVRTFAEAAEGGEFEQLPAHSSTRSAGSTNNSDPSQSHPLLLDLYQQQPRKRLATRVDDTPDDESDASLSTAALPLFEHARTTMLHDASQLGLQNHAASAVVGALLSRKRGLEANDSEDGHDADLARKRARADLGDADDGGDDIANKVTFEHGSTRRNYYDAFEQAETNAQLSDSVLAKRTRTGLFDDNVGSFSFAAACAARALEADAALESQPSMSLLNSQQPATMAAHPPFKHYSGDSDSDGSDEEDDPSRPPKTLLELSLGNATVKLLPSVSRSLPLLPQEAIPARLLYHQPPQQEPALDSTNNSLALVPYEPFSASHFVAETAQRHMERERETGHHNSLHLLISGGSQSDAMPTEEVQYDNTMDQGVDPSAYAYNNYASGGPDTDSMMMM